MLVPKGACISEAVRQVVASLVLAAAAAACTHALLPAFRFLQVQKLDLYLEGLAAFQEGASSLKAGDPLCLQQQEGGRLACMTRSGTAVGLVPADKRALLSRGPWSGTVRSVKRSSSAAAVKAATDAGLAAPSRAAPAAEVLHAVGAGPADGEGDQHQAAAPASKPQLNTQQQQELKQPASQGHHSQAAEQGQPQAQLVIQQVLVRFTPEEQRWQPRRDEAPPEQPQEEDTARLSQEQYEMLGGGMVVAIVCVCVACEGCERRCAVWGWAGSWG